MGLRPVFSVLLLALACGAACRGNSNVAFELAVPSSVVEETEWFEIGAFEGASCASVGPMLSGGVPEGFTKRVAFRKDANAPPPAIGQIPRASYAFGAVARGKDCRVLAVGCQEADVGDTDKVTVQLQTVEGQLGACSRGSTCQSARCVPANDNLDPSVGAGCSLELIGAGPVTNSLGGEGTLISAPAVSATETGFLVAYREVDANGAGARLTVLPIDLGGGAGTPVRAPLPDRCPNSEEVDGLGLIVRGSDALVALARSPCGDVPALELLNLSLAPLQIGRFFVALSPSQARISISAATPIAARGPGSDLLAFVDGDQARIATVRPEGIGAPSGSFGATSGVTGAWAAASDRVVALLASGAPSATVVDGGVVDAGASGSRLRLVIADVNTSAGAFDVVAGTPSAPITFPGEWGAVAARGTRVIVLSDGSGPGRSVTIRTFDLGSTEASNTTGFSVEGGGKVTTGAVAMQGDRAYFAALREGGIILAVFDNATLAPIPRNSVFFAQESRIPSVTGVRDGRVAITATDTRVIVAWTNSKVLGGNDYTGGYALFACTQ